MKNVCIIILALIIAATGYAQGPVEWKYSVKKTGDKLYELRLTAKVDEPWHIYSQQTPDGGPLPTKVSFVKNPLIVLQGKLKEEGDLEIYHEKVFGVDVYAYTGKVEFVQQVTLRRAQGDKPVKTNVAGAIEYMACTNEQCLPPATVKFNLTLE